MNKISDRRKKILEEKKKENLLQTKLFEKIWKERKHESEISGEYLGKEILSTYFHHILPKESYPHLKLVEDNIILITFDEHQKVESDATFYPIINERREKLKEKYGRYNQENILE